MIGMRRPPWWAIALTLAGVAAFVWLGVWQLHRADYKEQLLHRFATSAAAPLVPFAQVEHGLPDHRYPHVVVRGHYLPHRQYLLDDQIHANRRGVEVYTPFRVTGSSQLLLVDQGFLPRAFNNELPQLPPLREGEQVLKGLYALAPPPGLKLGGNQLPKQATWPKTVIYISLHDIGQDLGRALYPRVLLLDPNPAVAYVRQWVPDTMPPTRHRAYAFQWFTFAAAALVLFYIMNRKRPRKPHDHD